MRSVTCEIGDGKSVGKGTKLLQAKAEYYLRLPAWDRSKQELMKYIADNLVKVKWESLKKAIQRDFSKTPEARLQFHGRCKVDFIVEYCLALFIQCLARRGAPVGDKYILNLAERATGKVLEAGWLRGFLNRWPRHVRHRRSAPMDKPRVKSLTRNVLQEWIDKFSCEQRYIFEDGSNLFNADEVPAKYALNSPVLVWAAAYQRKIGCVESSSRLVKTFVPFVSASGRLWLLLRIYETQPGKTEDDVFLPATFDNGTKPAFEILTASTHSGYMTKELWKSACTEFTRLLLPQKESVLLLDNLASHTNPITVEELNTRYLRCFYIPAHTSHFLQPLDNGKNATIARDVRTTRRALQNIDSTVNGIDSAGNEPTLIAYAALLRCTTTVIEGAWERIGIHPFDPDLIRELAEPYLSGDHENA